MFEAPEITKVRESVADRPGSARALACWRRRLAFANFIQEKIASAGAPKVRAGLALAREARALPGV